MVLCGAASLACAPLERQSYGLPTTVRDQRITWHDCAVDDDPVGARLAAVGARCGEFLAPVD